jgi:hypothetical protein
VYRQFTEEVNSFILFWSELELLDERCWILEPLKPKKTDCFRRVSIENNASMYIKIDPKNPREIPEIIFLGCEACKARF